jgi:peroxiredoxin
MAAIPPVCEFGLPAVDFELPGTDRRRYRLEDVRGANGLLVMFICNHCPYVKAIIDRIVRDCTELQAHGIGSVAISANDPNDYPEDSFDNMRRVAQHLHFPFPYLFDESQDVAGAYGAVCTPDFFGYNAELKLQYRGRLDASRTAPVPGARRDLFEAMTQVARTGQGPKDQVASMGCSIKWRRA